MPLEDALDLVAKEYRRFFSKREQQERAGIALQAGDLADDFLAREQLTSYSVPLGIQHLLFLLSEGMHLYRNELNLLIDYLKTRKGHLEGIWHCLFSLPILNLRKSYSANPYVKVKLRISYLIERLYFCNVKVSDRNMFHTGITQFFNV